MVEKFKKQVDEALTLLANALTDKPSFNDYDQMYAINAIDLIDVCGAFVPNDFARLVATIADDESLNVVSDGFDPEFCNTITDVLYTNTLDIYASQLYDILSSADMTNVCNKDGVFASKCSKCGLYTYNYVKSQDTTTCMNCI